MAARRRGGAPGESSAVNVSALAGGAAAARRGPQPPKDDFDEFMQLRLFAPCPSCGGPHAASLPRTQPNPRASGGESERARGVSIPRARARAAPLRPPREVARLQERRARQQKALLRMRAWWVARARRPGGGRTHVAWELREPLTHAITPRGVRKQCNKAVPSVACQEKGTLSRPGQGPGTYCRGFTSVCWENGSL